MTHVTCRLTAKNRDQLGNPRSAVEYGLALSFYCLINRSTDGVVGRLLAGEIIASVGPEMCRVCRDNEGVCHRRSVDDTQPLTNNSDSALCACPISRTGDVCEMVRGTGSENFFFSIS